MNMKVSIEANDKIVYVTYKKPTTNRKSAIVCLTFEVV